MEFEFSPDRIHLRKFPRLEIYITGAVWPHVNVPRVYMEILDKCPRLIDKYFTPQFISVRDYASNNKRYHIIPILFAHVFDHSLSEKFMPAIRKFADHTTPHIIEILKYNGVMYIAYSPDNFVDIRLSNFDPEKYGLGKAGNNIYALIV